MWLSWRSALEGGPYQGWENQPYKGKSNNRGKGWEF
jgi:hypothetical protein